jgi:hypothetical protein
LHVASSDDVLVAVASGNEHDERQHGPSGQLRTRLSFDDFGRVACFRQLPVEDAECTHGRSAATSIGSSQYATIG